MISESTVVQEGAEMPRAEKGARPSPISMLATVGGRQALGQEIFNVLADGVYVLDADGLVAFVNPEAENMLGWKEADLLGRNGHYVFHYKRPDGTPLPAQDCPVHRTIRTGQTYRSFDDWLVRRDGSCFPVSLVSSPILRDGQIIGSVAAFQDISQRREMEAALRASEQHLGEILEYAPIGMAIVTPEGRFLQVNLALCHLLGYEREELLGLNMQQLPHGEDLPACLERNRRLLDGIVQSQQMETRYLRKDGHTVWVQVTVSLLRDDHGMPSNFIQQVEDVTERRAARQALKEGAEKFRGITNTANDAIILSDGAGCIASWNPAAEAMFGYKAEEVLGRDVHETLAPERFREGARRGFEHFCRSGSGAAIGKTLELAAVRKDGSEFPMELSLSAVRLEDDLLAVGFVRDISERKRAEHALWESKVRMGALLNASDESVLLLSPDGGILAINALAAERFGKAPENMEGRSFFDYLSPELATTRRADLEQVVATGEALHTQDVREGIYFDNSLYPVKDELGNVESVAVFARDVTEQRRADRLEEVFRELDNLLLKWRMDVDSISQAFCDELLPVFNLAAAWIGRAEKDGRLNVIARSGDESFFSGDLRDSCLRWDDCPPQCLPAGDVIRHGYAKKVLKGDMQCQGCAVAERDSHARAVLLLPLLVRGEHWGVLVVYGTSQSRLDETPVSVTFSNIARRLGAVLESALQQEWLSLLEAALADVSNGVFITNAESRIVWANQSLAKISGYGMEELLGKTPALFKSGTQSPEFYQRFWTTLKEGKPWRGDIVNLRRDGTLYTANQTVTPLLDREGKVSHFVAILEDISERKAAEERIYHAAHFDHLTDLPNRNLFFDRLEQVLALARREGQAGALLFLDLDHFKEVNDRLGHDAGDQLLVTVAGRLRQQVRESDTVARLAGDEFTIIMPRVREAENARQLARKIIETLGEPMEIAGKRLEVGVSIGIAFFPEHGDSVERILNAADHAMYQAKHAGRNTIRIWQAEP